MMLDMKNKTLLVLFVNVFCIFHLKRVKNTFFFKNGLTTCLLYLATIATNSHQTCVKKCLRDMRTGIENGRSR